MRFAKLVNMVYNYSYIIVNNDFNSKSCSSFQIFYTIYHHIKFRSFTREKQKPNKPNTLQW